MSSQTDVESAPPTTPSFAPRGLPRVPKFRQKTPHELNISIPRGPLTRAHETCSRAVNSRIVRCDNARFLEQFRYTIIASQILNDEQVNTAASYNGALQHSSAGAKSSDAPHTTQHGLMGAFITVALSFGLVWILDWILGGSQRQMSWNRLGFVVTLFAALGTIFYGYVRRQRLHYLRRQAIESASSFINEAQYFDSAATAAVTLIQEVELVSRGYRLSLPLPPVTRLEENSQVRRCSRLRKALHNCTVSLLPVYTQSCAIIRPLAEEIDLGRYFDIYDLSTTEIKDAELPYSEDDFEDAESLKTLKALIYRLLIARKIILCSLLALEADGGKPDFTRWTTAVERMTELSTATAAVSEKIRKILSEEEDFRVPSSPKLPVTPGRAKIRTQLRKLGSLSQGIRSLQAKMHILREECDQSLDGSADISELDNHVMTQYESIGADLGALIHEWECGKLSLAININRRKSLSSPNGLGSPASSLGGTTAFEGSPGEALRLLNGDEAENSRRYSRSSSLDEGELEVFEAVAAPRQHMMRSTLSREERIAKVKLEREEAGRERAEREKSGLLLKELKEVMLQRPRVGVV